MLNNKTIHELRGIAEGFGVPDVFSKTPEKLIQEIQRKQNGLIPEQVFVPPPRDSYDSAIMTKRPAKITEQSKALELLQPHIANGLELTFPDPDRWHMRYRDREDSGTLRMPPRVVINCADRLMRG